MVRYDARSGVKAMSAEQRDGIELTNDEPGDEQPTRRSVLKLAGGATLAALLGVTTTRSAGAQVGDEDTGDTEDDTDDTDDDADDDGRSDKRDDDDDNDGIDDTDDSDDDGDGIPDKRDKDNRGRGRRRGRRRGRGRGRGRGDD